MDNDNAVMISLRNRQARLGRWKEEKEYAIATAPEGVLRVSKKGERIQYYIRKDQKDKNGQYVKNADFDLVKKVAQKEYDIILLASIQKEIEFLSKVEAFYEHNAPEDVFEKTKKLKQPLISPVLPPLQDFIEEWRNVKYQGKGFNDAQPEFFSDRGERVRSKSEMLIANTLNRYEIPYRYEYPLILNGITFHPDFMILRTKGRRELFWEHFGLMDDHYYREDAFRKIDTYEQSGLLPGRQMIYTFETTRQPLDSKKIERIIMQYLK